ncbi:MAG: hypothetical protein K2Q10_00440, partial [Rhodospirillales bacterium]|nr:hypothetical protein [Rhodospirillales bacterium]
MVVWEEGVSAGHANIVGRQYAVSGTGPATLTPDTIQAISADDGTLHSRPAITMDGGGGAFVAWEHDGHVEGRNLGTGGGIIRLDVGTGGIAVGPSVAWDGNDGFRVAWQALIDNGGFNSSSARQAYVNGEDGVFHPIRITGDSNDNEIHAGFGVAEIIGEGGGDTLVGYASGDFHGTEHFDGGAGDDLLIGGNRANLYTFGAGADTIQDQGGTDSLELGGSLEGAERVGGDLMLTGGAASGGVTVKNHFPGQEVEHLASADGIFTLSTALASAGVIAPTGNNVIVAGGDCAESFDMSGVSGHSMVFANGGDDTIAGMSVTVDDDARLTIAGGAGADVITTAGGHNIIRLTPDADHSVDILHAGGVGDSLEVNSCDEITAASVGDGHAHITVTAPGGDTAGLSVQTGVLDSVSGRDGADPLSVVMATPSTSLTTDHALVIGTSGADD